VRRCVRAVAPGVDRSHHFVRDVGVVDRQFVALDDDVNDDRDGVRADTVVVEKGLRRIGAVRDARDLFAGRRFGLVEIVATALRYVETPYLSATRAV